MTVLAGESLPRPRHHLTLRNQVDVAVKKEMLHAFKTGDFSGADRKQKSRILHKNAMGYSPCESFFKPFQREGYCQQLSKLLKLFQIVV